MAAQLHCSPPAVFQAWQSKRQLTHRLGSRRSDRATAVSDPTHDVGTTPALERAKPQAGRHFASIR
jgi:hypothetical protein